MDDETPDGFTAPSLHGRTAAPAAPPPTPPPAAATSRRGFLVGGAVVVVVATGAGVAVGRSTGDDKPTRLRPKVPPVPAELAAAAVAERALIARIDTALPTAHGRLQRTLRAIRADHAAHLAAIEGAIAGDIYPGTRSSAAPASGSASASASASASGAPSSPAEIGAAEARAAKAAAARALRLTGAEAVLLATIAASEATHAEVLA